MHESAAELLHDLGSILRRARVRWFVFGAQAVVVHGLPRLTMDVDVTALVPAGKLKALLRAMTRGGFELRLSEGLDEFIATTRVLPFVHERTGMPLDVVLAGPGLEEEMLERAQEVNRGGIHFPVISPEDLVVLKLLAGRPKDSEDVAGVIARQGASLDLQAIRERLAELEAVLGQADLIPAFERLLASRRPSPTKKPPRGKQGRKR